MNIPGISRIAFPAVPDAILKWSFVLPAVLILVAFNILPLVWSLVLSFTDYSPGNPDWHFVGLGNYLEILSGEGYWESFSVTAVYTILSVSLQAAVGFGLALFVRRQFPGRGVVAALFLLPMMMSPVIVGLFWRYLYSPDLGLINQITGWEVDWLSDSRYTLWAIVLVDVWMWSPFVMLLCAAGLSSVPNHLYEAAEIDQATTWMKFHRITLPLVAPILALALVFRTMESFKTFDLALGVAKSAHSAPALISLKIYGLAFVTWDMGKACALAYVVLALIAGISSIHLRALEQMNRR